MEIHDSKPSLVNGKSSGLKDIATDIVALNLPMLMPLFAIELLIKSLKANCTDYHLSFSDTEEHVQINADRPPNAGISGITSESFPIFANNCIMYK